jgi:hypothetical protein
MMKHVFLAALPSLSGKGRRLLQVLADGFPVKKIRPDHPETFFGYKECCSALGLDTSGDHDWGILLEVNGMRDLNEWLKKNDLPAVTGLIVTQTKQDGRQYMPGTHYFTSNGRKDADIGWWQKQVNDGLECLRLLVNVATEESFTSAELAAITTFSEGNSGEVSTVIRERSQRLREFALKHFASLSADGKLRCACCRWSKPIALLEASIIEIHHVIALSDYPAIGEKLSLSEALARLTPLCPNCHRMLHAKPGGGMFTVSELRSLLPTI